MTFRRLFNVALMLVLALVAVPRLSSQSQNSSPSPSQGVTISSKGNVTILKKHGTSLIDVDVTKGPKGQMLLGACPSIPP